MAVLPMAEHGRESHSAATVSLFGHSLGVTLAPPLAFQKDQATPSIQQCHQTGYPQAFGTPGAEALVEAC